LIKIGFIVLENDGNECAIRVGFDENDKTL